MTKRQYAEAKRQEAAAERQDVAEKKEAAAEAKDASERQEEEAVLFMAGYAKCAQDVLDQIKGMWTHRTRELCPSKLLIWLKATAEHKDLPAEPRPAENARVEGEDVA